VTTTTRAERSRAIARHRAAQAALCDRVEPWAYGALLAATAHPWYWDFNLLRVEGPAPPELTAAVLAAEADRLQAGLEHRKVEIEDAATGARLLPGLGELGWVTDRLVSMLHDGSSPGRPAAGASLRRAGPEAVRALRREWLLSEGIAPEFVEQEESAEAAKPGERRLLVAEDDTGAPLAYAAARIDDGTGEVEDLYCTPSARGHGLGVALLGAAVAEAQRAGAGVDLWIAADADDWPQHLYERAGFRTVWLRHEAVRRPRAEPRH